MLSGVGGVGLYRIEGLVAGRGSDYEVDEGINAAGSSAGRQLMVVDVDLIELLRTWRLWASGRC